MLKMLNQMGPNSLTKLFNYKEISNYEFRNISTAVCLPQPRTKSMEKSFMNDGAYIWNSLIQKLGRASRYRHYENKIAAHVIR